MIFRRNFLERFDNFPPKQYNNTEKTKRNEVSIMKKTFLRIITIVAALTVLFTVVAVPVSASTYSKDIYLKIDGIDGESKNSKHDRWIELLNFTHGSMQSVQTGSPDVAGRGIYEPVVFKHIVDKATPILQEYCMKGNYIVSAQVDFCHAIAGKQEIIYSVKLEGVKVVKAEVEVEDLADGNFQLVETVTLLANKQTWTKNAIGLDNALGGKTEASFDQSKKASMFDSNTSIATVAVSAVAFVLIVVAVIFFVGKKKKAATANASVNNNQNL